MLHIAVSHKHYSHYLQIRLITVAMIEKHDRKCKDKYMKIILKDNWIELDIDISYPDYICYPCTLKAITLS